MASPTSKLAAIDFVRTFFCVGVVAVHCCGQGVAFLTTEKTNDDENWIAMLASPQYWLVSLAGIRAVPIFFMVSAFFTTLAALRTPPGSSVLVEVARWTAARYVRLFALLLPPLLLSLARWHEYWLNEDGSVAWDKVRGWLTLSGNYNVRTDLWMGDPLLVPSWSSSVDLHASLVLFIICRSARSVQGVKRAMYALLAASLAVRAWIVYSNPDCNIFIKAWADVHISMFYDQLPSRAASAAKLGMPLGGLKTPKRLPRCFKSVQLILRDYMHDLYLPTHARIEAFFIGGIMACNFAEASSSTSSKLSAWIWWSLSLVFVAQQLFTPVDLDALPDDSALLFLEATGVALFCAAVGVLIYAAVVPEGHPYHAARSAKLASFAIFAKIGSLSGWIYSLHFGVMSEMMRAVHPSLSPEFKASNASLGGGLVVTAITFIVTCVVSTFVQRYVDPIVFSITRQLKYATGRAKKA